MSPPPRQPQPLPGAHLTLTFPGAPSMPAGCHSKSKSYKQNEEKSLISIYSNEPCNNANHKSCSHCYSISVSYPSPHTFTGCLASSFHAEAPSQPQGSPRRGPASRGGTWAKAGSGPGLLGLRTAPNPGCYLCHSPGSIKRGKLFPGLISHPCFNLGARPPVIPPGWEGAEFSENPPIPA